MTNTHCQRRNIHIIPQKKHNQSIFSDKRSSLNKIIENSRFYSSSNSIGDQSSLLNIQQNNSNKSPFKKFKIFSKKLKDQAPVIQNLTKQQSFIWFPKNESQQEQTPNKSLSVDKKHKINSSQDFVPLNIMKNDTNFNNSQLYSQQNQKLQVQKILIPHILKKQNLSQVDSNFLSVQEPYQKIKMTKRERRASKVYPNQFNFSQIKNLKHMKTQQQQKSRQLSQKINNIYNQNNSQKLCEKCKDYIYKMYNKFQYEGLKKVQQLRNQIIKLQEGFKLQLQRYKTFLKNCQNQFKQHQFRKKNKDFIHCKGFSLDFSLKFGQSYIAKKSENFQGSEIDDNFFAHGSQQFKQKQNQITDQRFKSNQLDYRSQRPPNNSQKNSQKFSPQIQKDRKRRSNSKPHKSSIKGQLMLELKMAQNNLRTKTSRQSFRESRSRQFLNSTRLKNDFQALDRPKPTQKVNWEASYFKILEKVNLISQGKNIL